MKKKYINFFVGSFESVGHISVFRLLGFNAYIRVGRAVQIFGFSVNFATFCK